MMLLLPLQPESRAAHTVWRTGFDDADTQLGQALLRVFFRLLDGRPGGSQLPGDFGFLDAGFDAELLCESSQFPFGDEAAFRHGLDCKIVRWKANIFLDMRSRF